MSEPYRSITHLAIPTKLLISVQNYTYLLFFGSRMDVAMGGLTSYTELWEVAGIAA